MDRAMASAKETYKTKMKNDPENTKAEIFNAKWKLVPKVEVLGAPMTHLECYNMLPPEWQEMVLAVDMQKFATFLNGELHQQIFFSSAFSGPDMEYAQIMMSCGLLVCPADESDVERAEKTNTLVTLSNKHSKNCPNHQKTKSDDLIHGKF